MWTNRSRSSPGRREGWGGRWCRPCWGWGGGHLSIFRYIFQSVHLGLQSRSTEIYIDTPHTFITVWWEMEILFWVEINWHCDCPPVLSRTPVSQYYWEPPQESQSTSVKSDVANTMHYNDTIQPRRMKIILALWCYESRIDVNWGHILFLRNRIDLLIEFWKAYFSRILVRIWLKFTLKLHCQLTKARFQAETSFQVPEWRPKLETVFLLSIKYVYFSEFYYFIWSYRYPSHSFQSPQQWY